VGCLGTTNRNKAAVCGLGSANHGICRSSYFTALGSYQLRQPVAPLWFAQSFNLSKSFSPVTGRLCLSTDNSYRHTQCCPRPVADRHSLPLLPRRSTADNTDTGWKTHVPVCIFMYQMSRNMRTDDCDKAMTGLGVIPPTSCQRHSWGLCKTDKISVKVR